MGVCVWESVGVCVWWREVGRVGGCLGVCMCVSGRSEGSGGVGGRCPKSESTDKTN